MVTDLSIRREFNGYKSVGTSADHDAWCVWLNEHGIEPHTVWLTGWIERDEVNRRITYLALVLNDKGNAQVRPLPDGSLPGPFDEREAWSEVRTVQLESAPLPFPAVPSEGAS